MQTAFCNIFPISIYKTQILWYTEEAYICNKIFERKSL